MFLKPGAYDHIAFCAEDLSQWGQVSTYVNLCNWGPENYTHLFSELQ